MKFQIQGPREAKKTITEALRDEGHGASLADQVRALLAAGEAAEAATLVRRRTGVDEEEAQRFIASLNP